MCYSALVKRNLDYLGRRYGATWIREQVDDYMRLAASDPKRFPPPQDRIFPGHYAPVIHREEASGKRTITLMRYGAYPPARMASSGRYTTYNARRDNLKSPFWSEAFMLHHGFVVLDGFFEWVAVKDLLRAGVVELAEVKTEFARQAAERKARLEAAGKKYKPTATELKDPLERLVVIQFEVAQRTDLIAPVIFSEGLRQDGVKDRGFAIVTDDPPLAVSSAGHDRCPIVLNEAVVDLWLTPAESGLDQQLALLGERRPVEFIHKLDVAAS